MRHFLSLLLVLCAFVAHGAVNADVVYHYQTYNSGSGVATPHYGFKAYFPTSYANNSNSYPLIIFLHGIGERGTGNDQTNLDKVDANGLPKIIEDGTAVEAIVVCPQMPTSVTFYENYVVDLANYLKATYPRIDKDKVTLTGLSAGGNTVWMVGSRFPGAFAGYAPIGANYLTTTDSNAAGGQGLRSKPVWCIGNYNDTDVPPSKITDWMNNIVGGTSWTVDSYATRPSFGTDTVQTCIPNGSGGFTWANGSAIPSNGSATPRRTLYATGAHGEWERPYTDGLTAWLIAQTASPITVSAMPYDFSIQPSTPRAMSITVNCGTMHSDYIKLSATSSNTSVIANSGLVFTGTGSSRTLTITPLASTGSATITVTASDWSRASNDALARNTVVTFIAKVQTLAERITDLEAQRDTLNATIATHLATIATRDATIATLTSDLSSANAALASMTALKNAAEAVLNTIHDSAQPYDAP